MKIEATNSTEATRLYGRHFDHKVRPELISPVQSALPAPLEGLLETGILCGKVQSGSLMVWVPVMQDELVSRISRKSIDLLKEHFKDDMGRDDWRLIVKLKKTFNID